ncbi:hypothetical protein TCAL_06743, partial [Tigriopus californicus]
NGGLILVVNGGKIAPGKVPIVLKGESWGFAVLYQVVNLGTMPPPETPTPRVCSLHFVPADFDMESRDSNPRRKRRRSDSGHLSRKRLLQAAIPSQFPNTRSYLSKTCPNPRSGLASSSSRLEVEKRVLHKQIDQIFIMESIASLQDIVTKAKSACLPAGVECLVQESKIRYISLDETDASKIEVQFCLTIKANMQSVMVVRNRRVSVELVRHIARDTLSSITEIVNILSFLKAKHQDFNSGCLSLDLIVSDFMESISQLEMSEIQSRKVNFCLEQIHLAGKSNSGGRYSTDLLVCAAMWRANSPSLYRQIIQENILTLPSESHIKRLTASLETDNGIGKSTKEYLRKRIQNLSIRDRKVVLMFDEIYCASRFE